MVGGVGLGRTLVSTHLGQLHLHAELLQQVLQVVGLRSQTVPIDHTLRVQPDLIGHTSQVIRALRILVGIGYDPLTAFLEIDERIAQLLRGGRDSAEHASFYIDTFYIVILLGFLDGIEGFLKTDGLTHHAGELGHDIVFSPLFQRTIHFQYQHTIVLHLGRGIGRGYHTYDTHHTKEADQQQKHQDAHHCGEHVQKEIFHIQFYDNLLNILIINQKRHSQFFAKIDKKVDNSHV